MVCVQRKNNLKRKYAHVVPFLGKLSPVDHRCLDAVIAIAVALLLPLHGKTLIIGLAEASLVLAWQLMEYLSSADTELCFTTREHHRHRDAIRFQEPHSHGPDHWLNYPQQDSYEQIIIVEDEITTGTTIINLMLALRNYTSRFHIVAMIDLRNKEYQHTMDEICKTHGFRVHVHIVVGKESTVPMNKAQHRTQSPMQLNPYGRDSHALTHALNALASSWQHHEPHMLYMVGECVDVPMAFCSSFPVEHRPPIHHITRSPWVVDGLHIHSQKIFGHGKTSCNYYLYNWQQAQWTYATVISDTATLAVAEESCQFFQQHHIHTKIVEVPL